MNFQVVFFALFRLNLLTLTESTLLLFLKKIENTSLLRVFFLAASATANGKACWLGAFGCLDSLDHPMKANVAQGHPSGHPLVGD